MADARLQVVIDAVDNASKQLKTVERSLRDLGRETRQIGTAIGLLGGAIVGSMALAVGSTKQGQEAFAKLRLAVWPVQQAVADALVPALTTLANILTPLLRSFADWIDKHRTLVTVLAVVGVALVAIGGTLATLGLAIGTAASLVGILTKAFQILGIQAAAAWLKVLGPIALVAAGLLLVEHGLVVIQRKLGLVPADAKSEWEKLGGVIERVVDHLTGQLNPALADTNQQVERLNVNFDNFAGEFADIERQFAGLQEQGREIATSQGLLPGVSEADEAFLAGLDFERRWRGVQELMAKGMEIRQAWAVTLQEEFARVQTRLEELAKTVEHGEAILQSYRNGVLSLADAWKALGASVGETTQRIGNFQSIIRTSEMALLAQAGSTGTLFESFAELAAQRIPGGMEKLTRFRAGERDPELIEFIRLLIIYVQELLKAQSSGHAGWTQWLLQVLLDGKNIGSALGTYAAMAEQSRSS